MIQLTALAGPLERSIADHVEKELVNVHNQKEVQSLLENQFNWDLLAAGNVWAFGPEVYGSNVLINDSLVNRTDQSLLGRMRQSITQGFKWSTREGPLCDEPMRNVKFRVIEAELSKNLN